MFVYLFYFDIKNGYSDTLLTMQTGEWQKFFSLGWFPETRLLFLALEVSLGVGFISASPLNNSIDNRKLEYDHKCKTTIRSLLKLKYTQPAITCSKLTIEILEQGVKYVQS